MLFSRTSIGVEISPSGIAFALAGGTKSAPRLERVSLRTLAPGTIRTSLREPNILDSKAFTAQLNEGFNLLIHKSKRLSASLPDAAGRIMLLDMEGRFKSRSEGLDMIRWKLKKNSPFDMADTHLDYQLLRTLESGDMALLVCMISKAVIEQYEDSFIQAGFTPANINLNTFNLCCAIEQRLELMGDCCLVSLYYNSLAIIVFTDGIPVFLRLKELSAIPAIDSRLYTEIENSLLVYRERFPEKPLIRVACIAQPTLASGFSEMVKDATGMEPVLLKTGADLKFSGEAPASQEALFPFSAAIGAALRGL